MPKKSVPLLGSGLLAKSRFLVLRGPIRAPLATGAPRRAQGSGIDFLEIDITHPVL